MTPFTIAAIAILSVSAIAWMVWEFMTAPMIDDDPAVPDDLRDSRRTEPVVKTLERISKSGR